MPDPITITIIGLSLEAISAAVAVGQLAEKLTGESYKTIEDSLKRMENYFDIKINQPLLTALNIIADAEAEYDVSKDSAKQLANKALDSLYVASGQLLDDENQILIVIAKACCFKILENKGALKKAAEDANRFCEEKKRINEEEKRIYEKMLRDKKELEEFREEVEEATPYMPYDIL